MPLFKVALRMAHDVTWPQRRKWSTTFYVNDINPVGACEKVKDGWVEALRSCADASIFAYEVYATDLVPASDNYYVLSIAPGSQRGLRGPGTGDKYLTKAVATVELNATSGRPSRKFWRFGLYEGDVVNGASLLPSVVTLIQTGFTGLISAIGADLQDPDGQQLLSVRRIRLSTREFGRTAGNDVPEPPAVG